MDTVSGVVDSIIFQNEENGYTVCEIEDSEGYPIVLTGIIPYLSEGDKITAHGTWTNHQIYGKQFKAETYEKTLPEESGDILRYLASGSVKGIGPKTAQKIVEKFGTDSFSVIENHPDWLCEIPGITNKKAAAISESFKSISGSRAVMMFCRDFFTPQMSMKIYKRWGSSAIDRIKNNPYRLCEEIGGISFSRADRIAMSMGLDIDSPDRILQGLIYVLRTEASRSGHTCLPENELIRCAADLLFGGEVGYEEKIKTTLDNGIRYSSVSVLVKDGVRFISDSRIFSAERYVAKKLSKINLLCPKMTSGDSVRMIEKCEASSGITYADLQRKAMYTAMTEGVMILTGGPGTGKTTVIKGLISVFESLAYNVSLAAPTGRAAKRMSETTSHEAKTIHRLLEMDASDAAGSKFLRDENNTLDADVIIIDEASMIDIMLMQSLLRAVKNGSRLILIGDSDQLPSVGAGNVLGDIIDSGKFALVRLTEIFRQSCESMIIENAHRINEGQLPEISKKDGDFFFIKRNSEEEIASSVIELIKTRLPHTYGRDIVSSIQALTPSRKGISGTENLNEKLQEALNPPSPDKKEKRSHGIIFRVGDRVMQTKNNYTAEWKTDDDKEGLGIFNGDIGVIDDIDEEENTITVRFDDRICPIDSIMAEDLDHAYAVTVHKSQGSEYPIVIIPLYSCAPMLLTRNLLYTAITRASRMVVLVGKPEILAQMVENNSHAVRCTMLKEFLLSGDNL